MFNDIQQDRYLEEPEPFSTQEPLDEHNFRPLDARVIKLWRVTDLIGYGVLLIALLVSVMVTSFVQAKLWPWLMTGWLALALLCLWYSIWRPPRYYRSWGYRIDARVLETRSGIVFQRTRLLPLSRLQHVDIERGPFERMYGLASLILHTAGTHSASIRIPGLEAGEAVRLRNHLIEIGGDDAV